MGSNRHSKIAVNKIRARINADKKARAEMRDLPDLDEPVIDEEQMRLHGVRFSRHLLDTDPVPVNQYSPALDVASRICGVPYGMVKVAGRGTDIRSHEIKLDGRDISAFLPRLDTLAERGAWSSWKQEQDDAETRSLRSIRRRVASCRRSCENAVAAELQDALALSGI